jgi:hypothetical protein
MPHLTLKTAQALIDLMPSTTYGMNSDVDQFLAAIKEKLSDAVTGITTGNIEEARISIKIIKD